MNPIAFGTIVVGILLLVYGLFLTARRKKSRGIALSVVGLVIAAAPFVITLFLAE
jgi:hypothetical protein